MEARVEPALLDKIVAREHAHASPTVLEERVEMMGVDMSRAEDVLRPKLVSMELVPELPQSNAQDESVEATEQGVYAAPAQLAKGAETESVNVIMIVKIETAALQSKLLVPT